jgi:hypothetical protein
VTHPPTSDLAATAAALAFTRLVHFTPARNLAHILRDGQLRSSKELAEVAPEQFSPTDKERFDRHPDHLCCSFEYPNAYYRDIAGRKPEHVNYPNWVILTLAKALVLKPGALFCGCNAAKSGGVHLKPGAKALADCWANPSIPAGRPRTPAHLVSTPTDLQAEALIPGPVPLSEVTGIIVASGDVAAEQQAILRRIYIDPEQLPWKVAPVLFQKLGLTRAIQSGTQPEETPWDGAQEDPW